MLPAIPEIVRELSETLAKAENRGCSSPLKLEIKGTSEKIVNGTSDVERETVTVTMEVGQKTLAPVKNSTSWVIRALKVVSTGATWLLREVPREVIRAVLRQQIASGNDPDSPT